jgi:Spy/CpxP family protein refolding chaperone
MKDLIRSKAILYLVAIFIAGLAAGAVGGLALGKRAEHRKPPRADPKEMVDQILGGLKHELKLSEEQVRQIRPLIEETSREIHACHQDLGMRIGALIKAGNRRIEAFLTPEQTEKLAELERQHEERRREEGLRKRSGRGSMPP